MMKSSLPMTQNNGWKPFRNTANITELDAATLNRLIKEIVVHESH